MDRGARCVKKALPKDAPKPGKFAWPMAAASRPAAAPAEQEGA